MIDKVAIWLNKGDKKTREFTRGDIERHHTALKAEISKMGMLMFVDIIAVELGWNEKQTQEFQEHIWEWGVRFSDKAEEYIDECHELTAAYIGRDAHNELSWWVNNFPDSAKLKFTKAQIRENDRILTIYGSNMLMLMIAKTAADEFNLSNSQVKSLRKTLRRWCEAWWEGNLSHDVLRKITQSETAFNVKGW